MILLDAPRIAEATIDDLVVAFETLDPVTNPALVLGGLATPMLMDLDGFVATIHEDPRYASGNGRAMMEERVEAFLCEELPLEELHAYNQQRWPVTAVGSVVQTVQVLDHNLFVEWHRDMIPKSSAGDTIGQHPFGVSLSFNLGNAARFRVRSEEPEDQQRQLSAQLVAGDVIAFVQPCLHRVDRVRRPKIAYADKPRSSITVISDVYS